MASPVPGGPTGGREGEINKITQKQREPWGISGLVLGHRDTGGSNQGPGGGGSDLTGF